MVANTPLVLRFSAFHRQGTIPFVTPAAQWVDNISLAANTVQSYTLPTGTNPSAGTFGSGAAPAGATVPANVFRIVTTANTWLNANGGVAAVPAANNFAGNGQILIFAGVPYYLVQPVSNQPLSFIAATTALISIEAWF